jgi:hypothetical protein
MPQIRCLFVRSVEFCLRSSYAREESLICTQQMMLITAASKYRAWDSEGKRAEHMQRSQGQQTQFCFNQMRLVLDHAK